MGAGLGILFTFGAAYFAFLNQNNIAALWLLALLSFIFSGYRVWLKEHRNAEEAKAGPRLTGFFQDVAMDGYPYEDAGDGTDLRILRNRLGTEIKVIVRIVNETPIPTTIHDFSLNLKIDEAEYSAIHAEDDEMLMWFERKDGMVHHHREPVSDQCLIQYLGKRKIEIGQPLEGVVRFRVPGLFSDEFPSKEHTTELSLGVQDERGTRHFIVNTWGPPPRPTRQLEHGMQERIREEHKTRKF